MGVENWIWEKTYNFYILHLIFYILHSFGAQGRTRTDIFNPYLTPAYQTGRLPEHILCGGQGIRTLTTLNRQTALAKQRSKPYLPILNIFFGKQLRMINLEKRKKCRPELFSNSPDSYEWRLLEKGILTTTCNSKF